MYLGKPLHIWYTSSRKWPLGNNGTEKHDKECVNFLCRPYRRFDLRSHIILCWEMRRFVRSRELALGPLLKPLHFPYRTFPFRYSPEAVSSYCILLQRYDLDKQTRVGTNRSRSVERIYREAGFGKVLNLINCPASEASQLSLNCLINSPLRSRTRTCRIQVCYIVVCHDIPLTKIASSLIALSLIKDFSHFSLPLRAASPADDRKTVSSPPSS